MLSFFATALAALRSSDEIAKLLEQIRAGNRVAMRALYDRLAGAALAVATRILGERSGAEDVVQDAFVHVWQRAEQFDPTRGSARTWVLAAVRNRALDQLRRRAASWRTVMRASADRTREMTMSPTPLSEAERRQDHIVVQEALAALSDEQRYALELAYFDGLSHSEISEHLGEPLGTVKSRVRAAMEKLQHLVPATEAMS